MKYFDSSLEGVIKLLWEIVEHHTANVTNVTSFVPERTPKESSIEQKQDEHLVVSVNPPANSTAVKAPLPGTITKLNVKNGQSIKRGEILCILEAMKMENEIIAPADGTIIKTEVQQGSAVQTDDILVVIG